MIEFLSLLLASIAQVHYFSAWFPVMGLCSLALAYYLGKRFHWSIGLCYATTALLSVYIYAYPFNFYAQLRILDRIFLQYTSLEAMLTMTLFAAVFLNFSKRNWEYFHNSIAALVVIEACYILVQYFMEVPPFLRAGFYNNASMAGCFVGALCSLPGTNMRLPRATWLVLAGVAVLLTHSSMALAVYLTSIVFILWQTRYRLAIMLGIPVAGFAYLLQGEKLFSDSGRGEIIRMAMKWWWYKANHWMGAGPGTTKVFLPALEERYLNAISQNQIWLWLHSDWVQLLFEQGFIGLVVYLVAFVYTIKYAMKSNLLPVVMGLAVWALGNFPVHWPVHAFISMGIILMCFHFGRQHSE